MDQSAIEPGLGSGVASAPKLAKALRGRHVAMISLGGIIGAGLFVGSSAAIAAIGPAVIVSYALAGVIVLLAMRMLGEMAIVHPDAGAFTEFSRLGLGQWAGFTAGWLYWYFWVVVVAIEAIAGAKIVALWIPLPQWLLGIGLMIVLTGSNLLSTRTFGEFEFWFSSIKVAGIIAFIVIAGSYAFGFAGGSAATSIANFTSDGGFAPFGWQAVLAGVTTVVFAVVGAEITTVAAAEAHEGPRTIANLTTSLVVRIAAFYIISIALIVAVVPWRSIAPGVSPFGLALQHIGIPAAADIMNAIVLTAVLSCLNSGIYVASRVLFTLSRHGDAPTWLVRIDRRGVPSRAIIACVAFAFLALGVSVVSETGLFAFLVNASGALMMFVYLMTAAAHIVLRRRTEATEPEKLTLKMWLFPGLTYLTMAAMVGVLVAMGLTPALASQLWASLACLAVILIAWVALRMGRTTATG